MPNDKGCSDRPDDPRDGSVIPQAQPVEDLETVPLSDTLTDRQLKIDTSLSPSLQAEFIAFTKPIRKFLPGLTTTCQASPRTSSTTGSTSVHPSNQSARSSGPTMQNGTRR
ncbi:unnamed protein product [Prunus armeniaca]